MTGNGRTTIVKRYFAGAAAAFRKVEGVVGGRTSAHYPITLFWPDGRTPGGAGVWRIVEEFNAKAQRREDAKEDSFPGVLVPSRLGVKSVLAK